VYCSVVSVLSSGAHMFVPKRRKGFFKFWWNEELSLLKEASIKSNKIWKAAGKPHHGPIYSERQSSRLLYRKCLRDNQRLDTEIYTNDLHEALVRKNGTAFWQCWRSKFEPRKTCSQVNGCVDADIIVNQFSTHFQKAISSNNSLKAESLRQEYLSLRGSYCAMPITEDHHFDTELVSSVIAHLKNGKAAGIDGLSAEHLQFSHPVLSVIVSKLFQLMLLYSVVPQGFKYSYIVPVPKPKECYSKSLACDDFRGIAISPILSKVFEHCILKRFDTLLVTSDNQFGFKKGSGCSYAIRTVRGIVDSYIQGGSTANLCAIDLSKAFDKVNHHALFTKLMKRFIPNELLSLLEYWLLDCYSCVKWLNAWSDMFILSSGVRQGSVLSPFLFSIYLDDIAKSSRLMRGVSIVLYADDIILLAPSVCELQKLLVICEHELDRLDMVINVRKSSCLRIGPRNSAKCAPILTLSGLTIPWSDDLRYLGVFIVRACNFKCSLDHAKKAFYRCANSIFGKVGRLASEEVVLQLILSKCVPILLYGLEACVLSKHQIASLDFVINRFFMKLFKTNNIETVKACQEFFGFQLPSVQLSRRTKKFEIQFHEISRPAKS